MADDYRIVTVHIAGTIYAQGTTAMPVDSFGALPINKDGLLKIRIGETAIIIGRPLSSPQTFVAGGSICEVHRRACAASEILD